MKKFMAMYVEVGDSSDNRPRVLGVYDSKDKAVDAVIDDMWCWADSIDHNDEYEHEVDEDRMIANVGDIYCYWNVEEVQM